MTPASLSPAQARVLARLRSLHPDDVIRVHAAPDGEIVEVRRGRRAEFVRLLGSGELIPDEHLPRGWPRQRLPARRPR